MSILSFQKWALKYGRDRRLPVAHLYATENDSGLREADDGGVEIVAENTCHIGSLGSRLSSACACHSLTAP